VLIYERDPRQRQLPLIYTPQEPRRVMPTELAEEIVLTHPAQPFGASFNQIREEATDGANGIPSLGAAVPGADRYFWAHVFSGSHNDPTTRLLELGIRNASSGVEFLFDVFPAVVTNQSVAVRRTILCPEGYQLFIRADAIAAGSRVQLRIFYVDFLQAEVCALL